VITHQAPADKDDQRRSAKLASMWRTQVRMGMGAYYMFVERDPGQQDYSSCVVTTAARIFREA